MLEQFTFRTLVFLIFGLLVYVFQRFVLKKPADHRRRTLVSLVTFWLGSTLVWGLDQVWPGTGGLLASLLLLGIIWFFLDLIVLTLVIKTVKQRRPWQLALRVLVGLVGAIILYTYLT